MITRLLVDNFKCLVNFSLDLGPLNLILGPNGSGKSTTLDALRGLRAILVEDHPVFEVFPTRTLTRWDSRAVQTFALEIDGNGGKYAFRLEIEHDRERMRCHIKSESLSFDGHQLYRSDGEEARLYRDDYSLGPTVLSHKVRSGLSFIQRRHDNTKLNWFKDRIEHTWPICVDPRAMRTVSESEDSSPAHDLSNFASWYRHLSQDQQHKVFKVTQTIKDEVIDGFEFFRLREVGEEARALLVSCLVSENGADSPRQVEFRFDELSDGQRVLVALYTLLHCCPDTGATLCLDQPESFLGLPEIQPWLSELVEATHAGRFQAVLVSHHPELLDYLGAKFGIWLERPNGGPTASRRIGQDTNDGLPLSELVARGWLHG